MRSRLIVRFCAAFAAFAFSCGAAAPQHANPEIKDYEITRFVYLKTNCGLLKLNRLNPGGRPLLFHIECQNMSNWPSGMDITCDEPDDDRSCHVTTKERQFKHLDLLRRRD